MTDTEASVDVLVLGGGLAGLCALNGAIDSGASAALIEKTSNLGGSTVLSSGLMAFAGTDEQEVSGIHDNTALLRADLLDTGKKCNDPSLVDAYCAQQDATYRWLKDAGVEFGSPHPGSGQTVPRSHHVDTDATVDLLRRRAIRAGGRIRTGSRADRLIVEAGQVEGVTTGPDGVEMRAGTVVVCTGGFSRSEALLTKFAPSMERALRSGGVGNTGDGLIMGCAAGARLTDMAFVKATFGIFPWQSSAEEGTGILALYQGAIAVNGLGERFVDESLPYKVIGDACLAQPEALAYQIFDHAVMDRADPSVPIYDFTRRLQSGQIKHAETLAELADQLGVDGAALERTVDAYNRASGDGRLDPHGRRALCGGVGEPFPLVTPPFYGYPSTAVVLATYCGLNVDADTRVIHESGQVIPNLFAAGEVTGGFHGDGYVTGSSLGKSAVFGRAAGRAAAGVARDRR